VYVVYFIGGNTNLAPEVVAQSAIDFRCLFGYAAADHPLPERSMRVATDLDSRLKLLMDLAVDDHDGPPKPRPPRLRHIGEGGALRPFNLRDVRLGSSNTYTSLLRVLMTNACSFNCHYCPMRRDREMPRTLLKPGELVRVFLAAHRRGWCEGLFVTTGIPGRPAKVMDDLIQVLELLRLKHGFRGYIHVKAVPGAERAQLEHLTQLASRVSLNLETPCGQTLAQIAPEKSFDTSLASLEHIRSRVRREWDEQAEGKPRDALRPNGAAGMTTQFIVGATPDSDRAILGRVTELYARRGVHHTHFSAFRPIRDTPLEAAPETPVVRERRLYQTDYLLRRYGFAPGDVVFDAEGNLPLGLDPKVASALTHPERFPVDVRTASREELVRVPGIGPATARRIVAERSGTVLRDLGDLRRLGVVTTRAAGFLTIAGRRCADVRWAEQMKFWGPDEDVGRYHAVYEVSPGTFR
jgi:predicted DNA-binding helix-hairpin-helix protein